MIIILFNLLLNYNIDNINIYIYNIIHFFNFKFMNYNLNNFNLLNRTEIINYIKLLNNISKLLINKRYYISGDLLFGYLIKNSFIPKKNANYELILMFSQDELIELLKNNYEIHYNVDNNQLASNNDNNITINIKYKINNNIDILKIKLFNLEKFIFYVNKEDEFKKNYYKTINIKNNLLYNYIDYSSSIVKQYYYNCDDNKSIIIDLISDKFISQNNNILNYIKLNFNNIIEYNLINININFYLLLQNTTNLIINGNFYYFNKIIELLRKNNEHSFIKIKEKINIIFINNYEDDNDELFTKNIINLFNKLIGFNLIIILNNDLYFNNENSDLLIKFNNLNKINILNINL